MGFILEKPIFLQLIPLDSIRDKKMAEEVEQERAAIAGARTMEPFTGRKVTIAGRGEPSFLEREDPQNKHRDTTQTAPTTTVTGSTESMV